MRPLVILCVLLPMLVFVEHSAAQNYYPDRVGNRWVLRSTDQFDTKVDSIVRQEDLEGLLVTVIESQTNDNPPDRLYVTTETDGIWLHRSEVQLGGFNLGFDYSPPQIFIPIPLNLGATWTVFGETAFLGDIIALNNVANVLAIEDVTVPAGTFHSVFKIAQLVELRTPIGTIPFERIMWLATDVGIVKEVNTSDVVFELIEYEVVPHEDVAVQPRSNLPLSWAYLKIGMP